MTDDDDDIYVPAVDPNPVDEEFISAIERAGGSADFVAKLRKDRARHLAKSQSQSSTVPSHLWIGAPVHPIPLSYDSIQSLENAGARPELIKALRKERANYDRIHYGEPEKRSLTAPITIICFMLFGFFMIGWASCQSNTEPATSSPTTDAPSLTE